MTTSEKKSGPHSKKLDSLLMEVVNLLAADTPLPRRNFDHSLSGEWNDHRDCPIRPDLILIYRKPEDNSLELVRLGSPTTLSGSNRITVKPWQALSVAMRIKAGRVQPMEEFFEDLRVEHGVPFLLLSAQDSPLENRFLFVNSVRPFS